jgi:hypothetical protein
MWLGLAWVEDFCIDVVTARVLCRDSWVHTPIAHTYPILTKVVANLDLVTIFCIDGVRRPECYVETAGLPPL